MVVFAHATLSFVDGDKNFGLVIFDGCDDGKLFSGDCRSSLDHKVHFSRMKFVTQRQGRHVQQQDIARSGTLVARQDPSLDRRAIGNSFIRIDALVGFFAIEEVLQ